MNRAVKKPFWNSFWINFKEKKMKKTVLCLALMVGIMVFLVSCSTTHKMIVDKDVPVGQVVTVSFVNSTSDGWFVVREWNNTNIVKELYGNKDVSSSDQTVLIVPVGSTSFTFDVFYTISKTITTYPYKNIEMRYDLEQGKEYYVKGVSKSLGLFNKGYEFYVGIYDAGSDMLLKEWKIGEVE